MVRVLVVAVLTWLGLQIAMAVMVGLEPSLGYDIVALGLTHALVLGGATLLATQRQERSAIAGGFSFRHLGYGLVLGLCLKLPVDGTRALVEHWFPTDPEYLAQQLRLLRHDTWWRTLVLFTVLGGTGPFVEELFYRGYVFRALRRVSSINVTVGVSSVLFVVAHPSLADWPSLLIVGVVLGTLRAADGNLWSAVGTHAAFNSATVAFVVFGLQGPEVDGDFPVVPALLSAGLAAGLLTLRVRRT